MNDEISVRRGTRADAEKAAMVLLANYNMATFAVAKDAYLAELARHHRYVVATRSGEIVGLCSWFSHGVPHHGLAEIDRIAVLEPYRLQGVGRKIFEGVVLDAQALYEKQGHKLRKLFLLTHDDNVPAGAFYAKMGMEKEAVLPSHYYIGRDEAVFSKFF